ncbi:MAG: hypothetical protein A2Y33_06245 [Spirochaetes bacterium GWF1_51_8]|nr:MAG: hypothetical protein A2Y33_06245 [Spirochaetes bacterium GWF1_51_8]
MPGLQPSDYRTYRNSDMIVSELFIPYREMSEAEQPDGAGETKPYFAQANSVSAGGFPYDRMVYSGHRLNYASGGGYVFPVVLLHRTEDDNAFPFEYILERLKEGLDNIEALTFIRFDIAVVKDASRTVDFTNVPEQTVKGTVTIEYVLHTTDRNLFFYLVIPYQFLNFLVQRSSENLQIKDLSVANLFKILKDWAFFIVSGMDIFPWRLDSFILNLTPAETQSLFQHLLGKHYLNYEQIASVLIYYPEVENRILENVSKSHRKGILDEMEYFRKIDDPEWYKNVIYSVKTAIGHSIFFDKLRFDSLRKYEEFKDSVETIQDIELLLRKPADRWILEATDAEIDYLIHRVGIARIAPCFLLADYDEKAEARVLSMVSKRGQADYAREKQSLKESVVSAYMINLARVGIVKVLRDKIAGECFLYVRNRKEPGWDWWLTGVAGRFSMFKVFAAGGFPLFAKAFTGIEDMSRFEPFLKAIPAPASDIILKIGRAELSQDNPYNSDTVDKARGDIVRIIIELYFSNRIELNDDRKNNLEEVRKCLR